MNLSNIFFAGPADAAGTRIGRTASRRATRTVTRTVTRTATGSAARWAARLSVLCLIVLAQFPSPAMASAIEQLRIFATTTSSARGEFLQQQVRTNGRSGEASSGTFAFIRPGRFRWEVLKPIEQLIVTDGERVHFYDKDLKQVTVRKVTDAVSATPAAILFGSNDLEANFTIKDLGVSDGVDWLEAVPRSKESGFDRIRIGFRTGLPVAMEVLDSFGQTTRFVFRAIDRNPKLDGALFRFTAPAGVDVVQ
jgi:outer membrane lipoprotein carrier protein